MQQYLIVQFFYWLNKITPAVHPNICIVLLPFLLKYSLCIAWNDGYVSLFVILKDKACCPGVASSCTSFPF